jgi:hypothetical protein
MCAAGLVVAACSSSSPTPLAPAAASPASPTASSVRTDPASVVAQGSPRVTGSQIRTADGSVVTVAVFRGLVRYVLHNGSQDPGSAYASLVRAGTSRVR